MSKITLEQLQEHDGVKNTRLWTVLYDKVYDLTEFADKHPGGREMIESACARDATALFESYHLSSESIARSYLKGTGGSIKYVGEFDVESAKVGKLPLNQDELPNDAAIKFTFQSPLSGPKQSTNKTNIYEIMKQRIRDELIKNESSGFKKNIRRVSGLRLCNAIFIFTGLLTCQILSQYFPSINLGVAILLGLLAGLFHHLALVHVVHDLGHGSFTDFPTVWRLIGNFGSYVLGQSFYVWTIRHNVGHHVYTNMSEIDPDVGVYTWNRHIDNTPSSATKATCSKNEKVDLIAKMYSEPKDYTSVPVDIMAKTGSFGSLPFLYASLIFYMQIVDFIHYWTRHVSEGIAFATPTFSSTTFHFYGSKIFFFIYRIVLPIFLFNKTGGLIGRNVMETVLTFIATEIVAGVMFGFLSQINHISEKCAWPSNAINEMVDNSNEGNGGNDDLDWAAIQVTTCIDYCHDSYLWTYLSGFLNYQVIHHLFPGINPWLYPKILPIVKKVCKENNVSYTIYNKFSDALDSHVRQLTSFSKKQLLKSKILDH
ncbi:predicted protein [Naegleria gruberi]|uniref:Predicted protein n=1 Tax=Naegleria gruberi TaxID=5762 RepID=D2UXH4_NAEGR|nr:uncharacterized protein NAEGRDRAFT_61124 [Naegleria gruberi]EFC50633.1 predicted protein [Naegleria gruberi]|eukprot:XP_002683377.1 predicted protein [Naegleria gruberi strain NEG-M]